MQDVGSNAARLLSRSALLQTFEIGVFLLRPEIGLKKSAAARIRTLTAQAQQDGVGIYLGTGFSDSTEASGEGTNGELLAGNSKHVFVQCKLGQCPCVTALDRILGLGKFNVLISPMSSVAAEKH